MISDFDISVCQVAIENHKETNKFFFASHQDYEDVNDKKFTIKLKEFENTKNVLKRVRKYKERGFSLQKLQFENGEIAAESFYILGG